MKTKRFSLLAQIRGLIRRAQIRGYVFFHHSRKEPYPLYENHKPPRKPRGSRVRMNTFLVTLCLMTVLAAIYPLRPTYSELEKRNLTPLPEFSLSALADGSYLSGVSTWFADTFPLRDLFLSLQSKVENCYGIQTQQITGSVVQGDEIPDLPALEEGQPVQEDAAQQPASEESQASQPQDTPEELGGGQPEGEAQQEPAQPAEEGQPTETQPAETQPEEQSAPEETQPVEETTQEDEELSVPGLAEGAVVEQLNAVLTIDNAGYEYYNFVQSSADSYTAAINRAAEQLEGVSKVYSIIVPNSMGICVPSDVQEQVNTSDQEKAIGYMNACLSQKVTAVPVYHDLLEHYINGEYLYFRTDHHWTADGAYVAYEAFAQAAGIAATPKENYIKHEYTGFLGTFYSDTKLEAMAKTPDTVVAYESPSTNSIYITNQDTADWEYVVIGNMDNASAGNKYGTFIGGDNPISHIDNPNLEDGSSILLIKESYGNAFAPFLIDNYQHVYIVDYRYISQVEDRKLAQLCSDLGIQNVLFLNTISTTRSESLVNRLVSFVG